jgi:ATP-binding cassette subfamily B protein
MRNKTASTFWGGWRHRMQALRNVPPVLKMVWSAGPLVVASSMGLRLLAALTPVALLAVSKRIIDGVVAASSGNHPLDRAFWWLVALELALAGLGSIIGRMVWFCETLFTERFTRYLSIRIMEHASQLDLASYEDPKFYDKLERARAQSTDRVGMIREAGSLMQLSITVATLSASIVLFSPWLLLLLIACLIPAFLGESHFAFLGYSLNFSQTPMRRQMDYFRILGASKESAKELKLYGLSPFFVERFRTLADKIYDQNRSLAARRLWVGTLLSMLSTLGYYAAYAYVIYRTVTGRQSVGTMTFLAGAIAGTSSGMQNIFSAFSSIADQSLFLTDLHDFFAVKPVIRTKPNARLVPDPIRRGFEFRNVSFRYPGTGRLVLDRLNLCLEPGERVALIGENGQGKTTIVKLLTRLYDPTEGQILLDGVDLREYDIEDLYRAIGVVYQDFMRYEMTAAENIGIGRIENLDDIGRMTLATQKSRADSVIERLPSGYRQMLGRRFEGGVDLSGGEWQRIALARAYMRDAQILVLDEPTAALDAKSEHEVFQRFADLTEGKLALFISHRFSTVRMADRILVLEDGRIAEEGDHEGLMGMRRRYFGMFELQAANYR